jgi:putative ABC transport system substrate-binding protein
MMKVLNMKKFMIAAAGIIGCLIIGLMFYKNSQPKHAAQYTIGILQTASHPALDTVLIGFESELYRLMGDEVDFECTIQNAQGSVASAHTIAQQFAGSKKYDLFFTIATPTAQAMHAVEKERPIIFAAVTDPVALNFVYEQSNICGVTDMINVQAEVAMLKKLVPDAKTVGLLYTVGETNSLVLIEIMKSELEKVGLQFVEFAVSNESDMQAVVELACRKVDVLLAPTDNVVASTVSLIATIAKKYKKPFIASDNMLVADGALAAQGVDYKQAGKQAAHLAYELLTEGKKPYELPIEQAKSEQIFINQQTLELLGLVVPQELQDQVSVIA